MEPDRRERSQGRRLYHKQREERTQKEQRLVHEYTFGERPRRARIAANRAFTIV
jgi:hypothetical protein